MNVILVVIKEVRVVGFEIRRGKIYFGVRRDVV